MKKIIFFLLLLSLLLSSCQTAEPENNLPKIKQIFISVDETEIAKITLDEQGKTALEIIKDHPDLERLNLALKEIETKEGLELEYEEVEGETRYYLSKTILPPYESYIYALAHELTLNYGLRAEVK